MVEKKNTIFISYILDRVQNKNKNFFMIIAGATGTGKSYSALRLAELLDDTFNIDRVCFKAIDFMKKIKELQDQKARAGTVVLWDEFGTQHNAREFMTISNRVINYFFQTSRYLNLIVIMTVPLLSFVDSATRKLCHCVCETQSINLREKTVSVKAKMLQTNVMTGKEYPKYLRYKKNDRKFVLKKLKFPLPSKQLIKDYEEKKREFASWLYEDNLRRLEKVEDKNSRTTRPLTQLQEKILQMLSKHGVEEVANELGVSQTSIYAHKVNIEKKGVIFKPIWRDKRIICYGIEGFNLNSIENKTRQHV